MIGYILTEADKYVALDNASGGYPYITENPMSVHVWKQKEEAIKCVKMFHKESEWKLRELYGLNFSLALTTERRNQ